MKKFRNHPDSIILPRSRTTGEYLRRPSPVVSDKRSSYRLTSATAGVRVRVGCNRKTLPGQKFLILSLPPYNKEVSREIRQNRSGEPGNSIPVSLSGSHQKHTPVAPEHPAHIRVPDQPRFLRVPVKPALYFRSVALQAPWPAARPGYQKKEWQHLRRSGQQAAK